MFDYALFCCSFKAVLQGETVILIPYVFRSSFSSCTFQTKCVHEMSVRQTGLQEDIRCDTEKTTGFSLFTAVHNQGYNP